MQNATSIDLLGTPFQVQGWKLLTGNTYLAGYSYLESFKSYKVLNLIVA